MTERVLPITIFSGAAQYEKKRRKGLLNAIS